VKTVLVLATAIAVVVAATLIMLPPGEDARPPPMKGAVAEFRSEVLPFAETGAGERVRLAAERVATERAAAEAERVAAQHVKAGVLPIVDNAVSVEGRGGKDLVKAYAAAARAGNCEAAKRLGDLYDKGLSGVPRDAAESRKWFNAARVLGCEVTAPPRE
jgi:TPR repeat protein